jgi:FkbH-like protein
MAGFQDHLGEARLHAQAGDGAAAWSALREGLRCTEPKSFEYETAARLLVTRPADLDSALWPRLSIAMLGGYTTEPLANALRCAACREGRWAEVYEAPFQAYRQEILDPASGLYATPRDVVVLALHALNLQPFPDAASSSAEVESALDELADQFARLWKTLHDRLGCPVWQHTLEPLGYRYIGPAEAGWPAAPDGFIARLNERLRQTAPAFVHWVDTAALAQRVGVDSWLDRRLYYHGKYGFNPRYLDHYYGLLLGLMRVLLGTTRKALVVDLDNTLWGGVVGDDGVEGIQLGPGSAVGEAHADFCHYLRQLARRGIILAVCSKNEPAVAREVFLRHAEMPLKLDDFAAFHCSWDDKVAGLRAIARELNISIDHLAFADDNPAECDLVRQQLPTVGVIELKGDPAGFVPLVERGHWFDGVRLSAEDAKRAASYQALRQADQVRSEAADLPTYLRSLAMTASCTPALPADLPRLAQLEAKTNQFNLTSRRYDEAAVQQLLARSDACVLVGRLRDRFADHGLVASAILIQDGSDWRIDSWLMSCRVFSRTFEQFMLNAMIEQVGLRGGARLVGEFRPTERNAVVKELYPSLGFKPIDPRGPAFFWARSLAGGAPAVTFVRNAMEGETS